LLMVIKVLFGKLVLTKDQKQDHGVGQLESNG
jgi:hypothetical protein